MLRGESLLKSKRNNISDETVEEFFVSERMTRNLAKKLIEVSKCGYKNITKKIFISDLNEEGYNKDEYNVFIYDTLKYLPKSNSEGSLN